MWEGGVSLVGHVSWSPARGQRDGAIARWEGVGWELMGGWEEGGGGGAPPGRAWKYFLKPLGPNKHS